METMEATVERLPAKRRELLLLLKKRGEAGAEELAGELGVTASAVRQQLDLLADEGLVGHRDNRGARGRPRHRYHLTPDADVLFPKTYSELTNELLDYVRDSDPELVEAIFERRRRRRVEGAVARLSGKSFSERVAELARILDEDGYLADFEALPAGTFLVTEHNCAILGVAQRYGQACSSEIGFLREALPEARIERVSHMIAGAHSCAYAIAPA